MTTSPDTVPAVFVCVDFRGNFFALSIYNAGPTISETLGGKVNILIKEPVFEHKAVTVSENIA
jgi:hypothetical protein